MNQTSQFQHTHIENLLVTQQTYDIDYCAKVVTIVRQLPLMILNEQENNV
jgi:hypothetical protein